MQIGTTLIASLGVAIYDLDYKASYATRVPFSFDTEIGPFTYFDSITSPNYMYTWYDNKIRKFRLQPMCESRLQVRQASYTKYSWLKASGYGCENIETHRISSAIDWNAQPVSGG